MKTKRIKEPANFWKLNRQPMRTRRKIGVEFQVFGCAPDGSTVWAGVHFAPAMSARWAHAIANHWRRWRKWYNSLPWTAVPGYPRHSDQISLLVMFPIRHPEQARQFAV